MKIIEKQNMYFPIRASLMKIGQLARVINPETNYMRHIVLRTFDGIVSLSNPGLTWSTDCSLQVELLPPGYQITLEQE